MKRIVLCLVLLNFAFMGYGQFSSYKFDGEKKYKLSVSYLGVSALGVGQDSVKGDNLRAITFRFLDFDRINSGIGGYNTSHRWAFLPEMFSYMVVSVLVTGDLSFSTRTSSVSISDLILGWHNHSFNLFSTDDFNVGGGFHWGDYALGYTPYHPGVGDGWGDMREPAGWYGSLGPVLMLDYNFFDKAVLHMEGAYAISIKFLDVPDMIAEKGYPSPHFINLNAQIRTNMMFFGGMEYVRSINRGDHVFNASRLSFIIGAWF